MTTPTKKGGEKVATRTNTPTTCEDCEQVVTERFACNDYQVTSDVICPTCGHQYFCHEESRMEGEV